MSSPEVTVTAPAKINLGLWITGERPDGFHDLRTVFQAVDLMDRLTFRRLPEGELSLSVCKGWAPPDKSNLVLQAAKALWRHLGRRPGASVRLEKNIPAGSGLGGGSSDAAAALLALNRLWNLDLAPEILGGLALDIGSDVPFFLRGGTALGEGRGEVLTPVVLPRVPWGWILALPDCALSTREVFARLPHQATTTPIQREALRACVERGDLAALKSTLANVLEAGAWLVEPGLRGLKADLERSLPQECFVSMTGSGSGFYILTPTTEVAERCLSGSFVNRWGGGPGKVVFPNSTADTKTVPFSMVSCSPVDRGVRIH